jgi:hypothetical protein
MLTIKPFNVRNLYFGFSFWLSTSVAIKLFIIGLLGPSVLEFTLTFEVAAPSSSSFIATLSSQRTTSPSLTVFKPAQ